MALDPLLFDTYKRYKVGTTKLVSWLAVTARQTGLVNDMFTSTPPNTTGRPKGRARKQQQNEPQTFQIAVRDFTRLAKVIAESTQNPVPNTILKTIKEVIGARRECMEFFTANQITPDDATIENNEGHRHFILVLEQILLLLQGSGTSTSNLNRANDETRANPVQEIKDVANRFEYLEVEEPAEWTSAKPSQKSSEKKLRFEVEPSTEDESFAIFCFFKDLADIRYFVRQTWVDYRERQITLPTAAVTMNAAISLFRRLNDDFVSDFPQFDEHDKIIDYLYNGFYDPNGCSCKAAGYQAENFELTTKVFFCEHTFEGLNQFFIKGGLPMYRPTPDTRLTEDEETLFQCLSLFGLMDLRLHQEERDIMGDQLLKGLSLIRKDKKVYTWVVLAVQLFVDARRVLGKKLGRCMEDLRSMEKWMSAAYNQCVLFGETNHINNWHSILNHGAISTLRKKLKAYVRSDIVQELLENYFVDEPDKLDLYSWGPFFLFKNHPMLCGLIMQKNLSYFHSIGIGLTGDQGAVMATIHLYNAAHQRALLPPSVRWADLDKLIDWQGPAWIFVGKHPEDPGACYKHFRLAFGDSITMCAKDRKRIKAEVVRSQRGNRKLRAMSKYAELSTESVGKRRGYARITPAAGDISIMLEMMARKCSELELNDGNNRALKAAKQRKLTPLQMLSVFKRALQADEEPINFDMLTLNQRCVEFLRAVQKVCLENSPTDYTKDHFGRDSDLISLVSHMLKGEAGIGQFKETRFAETCQLIQKIAETEGAVEYEKSIARCTISTTATQCVDDFKTPVEDDVLVSERQLYGNIIVVGENDSVTIL